MQLTTIQTIPIRSEYNCMTIADIKALYEEYTAEAEKVERESKPADGLFGMGRKPSDDPCHDRFSEKLEAMLKEFADGDPAPAEVYEVLEYIYSAPAEHKEPLSVYWLMNAVQGFTSELVQKLEKADAERLYVMYRKEYPRWKRLPVQKKIFSELDRLRKK